MADKRICELTQATDINDAAFLACDDSTDGTKKLSIEQLTKEGEFVKEFKGECLAAVPTYKGSILLKEMYGMSAQDGTPTPSDPVEIKSAAADFDNRGKNLIDISKELPRSNASTDATYLGNGIANLNGTASANAAQFSAAPNLLKIRAKAGDKITLSYEVVGGTASPNVGANTTSIYLNMGGSAKLCQMNFPNSLAKGDKDSLTATLRDADITDGFLISGGVQIWMIQDCVFNNLQLAIMLRFEESSEDFLPYEGQNIDTDLTLRAIEVSSTDSYNFVKDGKYYIADTLEKTAEGYQVVRRVKHLVIDENAGITVSNSGKTMSPDDTFIKPGLYQYDSNNIINMNNRFTLINGSAYTIADAEALLSNGETLRRNNIVSYGRGDYFRNDSMASINDWKAWLELNPIEYDLVLINPIIEPVSQEAVYKLLSLRSYDEATYLAQTADTEGYIILEYGSSLSATQALTGYVEAEKSNNGDVVLFKKEAIVEEGTYKGGAILKKMYGMSIQDGTPTPSSPVDIESAAVNFTENSKNLIPYPFYQQVIDGNPLVKNGVTITALPGGKLLLKGTHSNTTDIYRFIGGAMTTNPQYVPILPNRQYYFKGTPSGAGTTDSFIARYYLIVYDKDFQEITLAKNAVYEEGFVLNTPSNAKYFRLVLDIIGAGTFNNMIFDPCVMLLDSNVTADSFITGEGQEITTDLILRAIEVTASDDYNLVKDGKYYIADTLEKIEGGFQIVRRVASVTVDGNTTIATVSGNTAQIMNSVFSEMRANINKGYSDHYKHNDANVASGTDANNALSSGEFSFRKSNITQQTNERSIYIKNSSFTSTSDASSWFTSNNTIFTFVLETPTVEAVTDANALALLSLNSYDDATYIVQTATVEGDMEIEIPLTKAAGYATMGAAKAESNEIRIEALES